MTQGRPELVEGRAQSSDGDLSNEYAGSGECQTCHADEHAQWKSSLHIQMTKPIGEARVLGNFSPGTTLEEHGRSYRMESRDGRYFISVGRRDRPSERFEVHYTLGALRFQGYLSKLPDGRIYVLPVFWNQGARRWVDWQEIAPVPDGDHDIRQIWNVTCFNCHATNLVKHFDVTKNQYSTTWTEMGIGCEGCHGPAKAHTELMEQWVRDPDAAERATSSGAPRNERLRIFAARTSPKRQVFDVCAYCHGNKNNAFLGFRPGERMEDFAMPFLISQPNPDNDPQGDFWPDGRPSRFNRPQALMQSGCFQNTEMACTNCHVAHGSKNPHSLKVPLDRTNELCTQCHKELGDRGSVVGSRGSVVGDSRELSSDRGSTGIQLESADLVRHTRHAADSAGSRCINCHMSDVNWRLLMRRRDHTFQPPVPELTAKYGIPNACTECHDDRSPEWAVTTMNEWFGDHQSRRGRAMVVADAFYEAGAGNVQAVPALAQLAVDRTRSPIIRASAAEFIERLLTKLRAGAGSPVARGGASQTSFEGPAPVSALPRAGGASSPSTGATPSTPQAASDVVTTALVNALIGAASDPEAIVRVAAVRALGLTGERRAIPPLTARLVDGVRLARISAAEALLSLGVPSLPGPAGEALAKAQDEYATSLKVFSDEPSDHLALGWLELERGHDQEARAALRNALTLAPENLRARVWLGVIEARNERYDEALTHWRQVRERDPNFPNIDRLIQEAERRKP